MTLGDGLCAALEKYRPERVIGVEPGDLRVRQHLEIAIHSIATGTQKTGAKALKPLKTVLEWREDKHFLCSLPQFRKWAGKSTSLRMEFFYRTLRKQYKVLMEGDEPIGGQWNFDSENRKSFGKAGPRRPNDTMGVAAVAPPLYGRPGLWLNKVSCGLSPYGGPTPSGLPRGREASLVHKGG